MRHTTQNLYLLERKRTEQPTFYSLHFKKRPRANARGLSDLSWLSQRYLMITLCTEPSLSVTMYTPRTIGTDVLPSGNSKRLTN